MSSVNGSTVRIATGFAMWEYQEEEKFLNTKSAEGLQLVCGESFDCIFIKDPSVRYSYQIDFNPGKKYDDRYKELYAEQGWEYINSTWNGWHYFRKVYTEGQQDGNGNVVTDERIYTDFQSQAEMENRWKMLARFITILYLFLVPVYLIGSIRLQSAAFALFGFDFLLFGFTVFTGIRQYSKRKEDKNYIPPFTISFRVVLPIFILIAILAFCFGIANI